MDPPTIIALKQAFLELQTRQLAQSLAPSRTWQRKNDLRENNRGPSAASYATVTGDSGAKDGGRRLPPKIVDDVLARVNQILILHGRRVHPPAAVRHVAEQLDRLYQNASEQIAAAPSDSNDEVLDWGMDYTTTPTILGLPLVWDDIQESDALPLESRRYTERLAELRGLAERRTATAARVGRLRKMVSLLEDVSLIQTTSQESLVTREGPVEAVLERMRVLLARVGDRLPGLPVPVATAESRLEGIAVDGGVGENAAATQGIRDVEEVLRQRAKALLDSF